MVGLKVAGRVVVPHSYAEFLCFWCDKGFIISLPAICPVCKHSVFRRVDEYSTHQIGVMALEKIFGPQQKPTVTLAAGS